MSELYDCADPEQRRRGLSVARAAVGRGDLVVLPTDTVYGLGADAFSPTAVSALLLAKGRGRNMPVPVLVGSRQTLDGLAPAVPKVVEDLVTAFWPGGLTVIVRHAPSLAWDLGESRGTVAVRMPNHPIALELLIDTGPLAVSSANRTGLPPATTVEQARAQLGEEIAVYLDGGRCAEPVPSTIVDATGERVVVRRLGAVDVSRLRAVVPDLEVPEELSTTPDRDGADRAGSGGTEALGGAEPAKPNPGGDNA